MDMLVRKRARALSSAVDRSTQRTYGSALNSWIAFIEMHISPLKSERVR